MLIMSGSKLKQMAEAAGLSPVEVLHEAGIGSPRTLYRVYNDEAVRPTTRAKVERAIKRLSAKTRAEAIG
jgi:hypothetical protein